MRKKIVKWEEFFIFDDGTRESMWEITRKPGKNLLDHELKMLGDSAPKDKYYVRVLTYADGATEEI